MITCPKCKTEYDGAERFCPKDGTRLGTGEIHAPKVPSIAPGKDPLINTVIQGRYRVIAQIGEGGMGVVYEAEHVEIEKKVALKVLRDDFSKRPEVVARFRQEARSAGKIGNAHIVDVTDFGQLDNGGVYFVMEHLQGRGLNDLIRSEVISVERGVYIIVQIARALKAAHRLGIVHRDLKPENIFLVENDEERDFVKILDFGIAKISDRDSEGQRLTKTGMIFGTPEYMSPEQAAGKTLDHRVDIYALGCIMFEMFTGRVPFEGESFMAVLTQHMFEPPPPLEEINPDIHIPYAVQEVIYKAMAKDKEDRFGDMLELAEALERAMLESSATLRDNSAMRRLADYRMAHGMADGRESSQRIQVPKTSELEAIPVEVGSKNHTILYVLIGTVIAGGLGAAVFFSGILPIGNRAPRDTAADTTDIGRQVGVSIIDSESAETKSDNKSSAVLEDTTPNETDTEKRRDSETGEETLEMRLVNVKIESEPSGGVVVIEGMGQVCSQTPCEIALEYGVSVNIEVALNGKRGKMAFTPSDQNKELTIELPMKSVKKGGRKNPRNKGDGKPPGRDDTPKREDDLKIPSIFKKN